MSRETPKPAPDPAFFNGRFMIETEEWNWALPRVPGKPRPAPQEGAVCRRGRAELARPPRIAV